MSTDSIFPTNKTYFNVQQTPRLLITLNQEFFDSGITGGDVIRYDTLTARYKKSIAINSSFSEVFGIVESIRDDGSALVVINGCINYPSAKLVNKSVDAGLYTNDGLNDIYFLSGYTAGLLENIITPEMSVVKPIFQKIQHDPYTGVVRNYLGYRNITFQTSPVDLYAVPTEANKRMFAEIGLGSDGGDLTWNSMTNIFISAYQGDPHPSGARAYPWEADPANPEISSPWHNVIYETTIDIFNWGCRAFSFYGPWGGETEQPFWKPQQWKKTFTTSDPKVAPARWKGFKYAIRALLEGTLAPDGKTPIDEPCNVHIYMTSTRGVTLLRNPTNVYWESLGTTDTERDENYYIELNDLINDLIEAKGRKPNSGKLYISVGSAVACATPDTLHLYRSAAGYKTDALELGDWYIMNKLKDNGIVHLFEARYAKTLTQSPHGGNVGEQSINGWAGNPMTCGEYWLWYSNPDNENPGFNNYITNQETPLMMRLYDSFYPLPSYVNGATVDPYQVQLTYIHAGQTRMLRESDADSSIALYTPSASMFEFYRISDNYRRYNDKNGVVFDYPNILSFNFTRYMGGSWYHPVYNGVVDPQMKYWRVSNIAIHTRSEFNTAIFLADPFGYGATNAAHGFWTPTGKDYWDNNIRQSTFDQFITVVSQYSDDFCPPNIVGCNKPVYGSTADILTRSVIDLGKW
jgi:hypothetical protein